MKVFAAMLSVVLTGCAATPERNYQPSRQEATFPPIGAVHEAAVGDDILRQRHAVLYEAISVPQKLPIAQGAYTLSTGLYRKIGQNADGEFFVPWGGAEGGQIVKIAIADEAQALVIRPNGRLCVVTVLDLAACGAETGFERVKHEESGRHGEQALVYNGTEGAKVTLGYRGPSGAVGESRNAVQYDLAASREIVYRGARIEVLDATPRSIKYRVLKNFTPPPQ